MNDVMLAIVAGGLRHYLAKHSELPDESLCAMLPQDVRSDDSHAEFGNQVGGLFADMHTDVSNPLDRLVAIHDSTTAAKRFAQEMDTASLVQNYMGGFLNPRLGRALNHVMQNSRILERFGPFACNTMLTNLSGPNFPLYHAGAKLVAYWGIPTVTDCLGLSHAVFSYCGRISLSASACRQMMPDPAFYMECIEQSFEELLKAAKEYHAEKNQPAATIEPEAAPATKVRKRAASSSSSAKNAEANKTVAQQAASNSESNTSNEAPTTVKKVRKKAASSSAKKV